MATLSVDQTLSRAKSHAKKGEIEEASKLYHNVLQVFPKNGRAQKGLDALRKRIASTNAQNLPPELLHRLLGHYQKGRFNEAEKLAVFITQEFPKHQFAWKVLGVILKTTGRKSEALEANQRAVALSPQDAEAYFNLGNTLKELGRLDEAEASYNQAIVLKPDYAEAYSNLGVTQKELGRLDEAEASYNQAIALKSDYAEAFNNLGNTLQELGRLDEAEASYKQAIVLKPDYAEAYSNLGVTQKELGRLDKAEASYKQAIALKPDYAEAYNNLGNTLQELGRLDEAEASYKQAIVLKPDYAEAYSNLGVTQKELGRLDKAEASYKQAIALKPDYAEAYNNLGNTLKELGRLDEAEASYKQALALKPDHAEAHYNLGIVLQEIGELDKAEASYKQAIVLKPDYAEAYSNLGVTQKELGRLDKAEASYKQAIALKPDYAEAIINLSITQGYMNDLEAEIVSWQHVLEIGSDDYGFRASVNLAICKFLEGDFTASQKHLLAATRIQEKTSPKSKNERAYRRYLSNILKWHGNKYFVVNKRKNNKYLYVIGESHSLSSHHLYIHNSGDNFLCSAYLIKGCKQWHLGNAFLNEYKHQFHTIFLTLPRQSQVLLAIGEIDCRLDTGIIAHKRKFPEKQIKDIVVITIENYLNYIVHNNSDCQHKVTIQGVPCPNLNVRNHSEKDIRQLVELINIFNYELKMQSKKKGFGFLDTHQLTDRGDGMSNGSWHIDDYHLSPEGMQEAWRRRSKSKI